MVILGIAFACLSGIFNGLFTAPMKMIPSFKWENTWLVFIIVSCLIMPVTVVLATVGWPSAILASSPFGAIAAALGFGFAWGFGAIFFGRSVDRLGVSVANSIVIGVSAALGSLIPLVISGNLRMETRQLLLFAGVLAFMTGVGFCGAAGRAREAGTGYRENSWLGYLFALGAGIISAIFNIGYALAMPIADAGEKLGNQRFLATNVIWLLMLGAGAIPNVLYCGYLIRTHRTGGMFVARSWTRAWSLSILMGLLWGGSIFLYGAATPLLGSLGPSVGWPLSLAVALVVANTMGFLLNEWKSAQPQAVRTMRLGIATMLAAVFLCALSANSGA